jgi:hypothetical protein
MTRGTTNDPVTVAPTNNIYTALTAAATVAVLIGLIVLFIRAKAVGVVLF